MTDYEMGRLAEMIALRLREELERVIVVGKRMPVDDSPVDVKALLTNKPSTLHLPVRGRRER